MNRLDQITELYLGGQSPREFLENGGDAREYAELVFNGTIFGRHEDPAAPEVGINTVDDLTDALTEILAAAQERRQRQLDALNVARAGTQFQPLNPDSPTVLVQVRLTEALRNQVDTAAALAGVTRSEWLRTAAEKALERGTMLKPDTILTVQPAGNVLRPYEVTVVEALTGDAPNPYALNELEEQVRVALGHTSAYAENEDGDLIADGVNEDLYEPTVAELLPFVTLAVIGKILDADVTIKAV